MSRSNPVAPKYGEIWLVESTGEKEKTDPWPAVVISSNAMEGMPLRLVARIEAFRKGAGLWCVEVPNDKDAGLQTKAIVDAMKICSVETRQCRERLGRLPADCMTEVAAAVAILVEYE